MHRIRLEVIVAVSIIASALFVWQAGVAIADLIDGDEASFLAFPLAVILPALALGFLVARRGMASAEGALMQLGTMIQLVLIIALPDLALHLALGFPVVFLAVELFETRLPHGIRDPIRRSVLA